MLRRPTKDQTRCRLVSDGLVGESREDGGSANAAGLVIVLVPTKMGGSGHYEIMAKCMSEGSTTRGSGMRSTAVFGHRDRGERLEPSAELVRTRWDRCPGACGLGGSSARWLGGLTARQLTGPVAEAPYAGVRRDAGSDH